MKTQQELEQEYQDYLERKGVTHDEELTSLFDQMNKGEADADIIQLHP